MRYTITRETSRILKELTRLAESLQEYLPSISTEARREWEETRLRWPSELEVRQGMVALNHDELAIMESKVRRFHNILAARASSLPDSRLSHSANEGGIAAIVLATGALFGTIRQSTDAPDAAAAPVLVSPRALS